jgi:hypothetical protein
MVTFLRPARSQTFCVSITTVSRNVHEAAWSVPPRQRQIRASVAALTAASADVAPGNAASGASAPPAAAATRGITVMEGDRKPAPETRGWDWLDPAHRGRARGLALAIVPVPSLFSGNTDQAQALLMALARQ